MKNQMRTMLKMNFQTILTAHQRMQRTKRPTAHQRTQQTKHPTAHQRMQARIAHQIRLPMTLLIADNV